MQGFDEFVNNQAGAETNDPDGSFDGFVKAQTPSSPPSFDDFVQKQPKPKRMKRFDGGLRDDDVPRIVDEELRNLGWSDNARLSMLGNLGRENSWKANTIFAGHKDPKNAANNLGIISWQKERRDNLVNYLQKNGGDLTPNEKNLRLMARFMDDEMKGSNEWRDIHQKVRNPNLSTKEASQLFRRYIKYVPTAPYNTPDDEFDVVNNRKWAEKARSLGIGGNQPLNASPQSYAPVPQNVPRVEVEVGETLASPLPKDPQAPITENWSPFEKPSPQVPSPTVPGTQTIKSPKLNAQEYMTDSKGNKYFSADQTDVLPGYTRVRRTDEGGEEQFFLLDPKNNILPESAVTEFGVKRYDSEGLEYLPTQDPKVFQRFDKVGNPTNYIFNDDGTISREGVAALPEWVQGKRAPVTPMGDKVLEGTLKAITGRGVPDSEELRQKILKGYEEVKAGRAQQIFSDEDNLALDNLTMAKEGMTVAEVGQRKAAPAGTIPGQVAGTAKNVSIPVDLTNAPQGTKEREAAEQGIKKSGKYARGKEYSKLETQIIVDHIEATRGTAAVDPATGKPYEYKDDQSTYTVSKENMEENEAVLRQMQPKIDEIKRNAMTKFIHSAVPLGPSAMSALKDLGFTEDEINLAVNGLPEGERTTAAELLAPNSRKKIADEYNFARETRAKNKSVIEMQVKEYLQTGDSPNIAAMKAYRDIGVISPLELGDAVEKERAEREALKKNLQFENKTFWGQMWDTVKRTPAVAFDYYNPWSAAEDYSKSRDFGERTRSATDADRRQELYDFIRQKELGWGSIGAYNAYLKMNEGAEYDIARQARHMARVAGHFLAEVPKSLSVIDSVMEDIGITKTGLSDEFTFSLRTAGNLMGALFDGLAGRKPGESYVSTEDGVEHQQLYQLGKNIQDWLGQDEYLNDTTGGQITSALTSGILFLAGGFALKGMKYAPALLGALSQVGATHEQLVKAGVEPEEAKYWATVVGTVAGGSEQWGLGGTANRMLSKLGSQLTESQLKILTRSMYQFAKEAGKAGLRETPEEFFQEWGQSTFMDSAVKAISAQDKTAGEKIKIFLNEIPKNLGKNLGSAAIGGLTGFLLGSATHTVLSPIQARKEKKFILNEEQERGIAVRLWKNDLSIDGEKVEITDAIKPLAKEFGDLRIEIAKRRAELYEKYEGKEPTKEADKQDYIERVSAIAELKIKQAEAAEKIVAEVKGIPEGAPEAENVPTGQETAETDAPFFTIQGLDGRVLVEMQDEAEFRKAEADITSKLVRGELREDDYEDYVMRTYGQQPVEATVAPSQQSPADIPVEVEDWLQTAATDQQQTGLDLGFDTPAENTSVDSRIGKTFTREDTNMIAIEDSAFQKKGTEIQEPDLVKNQLQVGDKITFFVERERTGIWDGEYIRDEKGQPWGVMGILADTNNWIRVDAEGGSKPNIKVGDPVEQDTLASAKPKVVPASNQVAVDYNEALYDRKKRDDWYKRNPDQIKISNEAAVQIRMGKTDKSDFRKVENGSLVGIKRNDGDYDVIPRFDSVIGETQMNAARWGELFDMGGEFALPEEFTVVRPAKVRIDSAGKVEILEKGLINPGLNNYAALPKTDKPAEQKTDSAPIKNEESVERNLFEDQYGNEFRVSRDSGGFYSWESDVIDKSGNGYELPDWLTPKIASAPAEKEEKIKSFKQPKPGGGGVKFNPKKDSLSKFVVASGGIAPSNTIDLEAIVNANVNKKGKQKGGFASLIRKDGASVEDMFRMAVEAGFFADKNTQYSPGAEDAASQNYDFTVDDFVQAVAQDAGIAPDKDGNLVPGKVYTIEAINLIGDTLTELENDHHNRQKEEQEKQEEMATKLDAVYQNPEVIKLLAEIERKGEATDEQESQLEDILYDAGLPQDFAAAIIHELTKGKTDARQVQDDAGATGFEPEIDSPIFQDEEIEDAAFDDFNNLDTADEGDLDFDFADEEKPAEQSKPPADLFGNELEARHQDSLFGKGELAETETGFNQANIEATRKVFGSKTADFLGQMLHSKDKSVRVVAETITERGKLVEAKGDEAKQIVEDVSDALDVFRLAKEQKGSVEEVLAQPRLDGVQFSDTAKDFARAMEAGSFAKKFDAALSEAKTTAKIETKPDTIQSQNEGYNALKEKVGEKAARKYFEQVDRLFPPYTSNVVEYRENGVVTKDGDKYTFHALADKETKQWRVGFKSDVTDQFVKTEVKDEGKRTEEKQTETDDRLEPAVSGDSDRPGLATYYEGSIPKPVDRTPDGIGKNLYPHQKQGVNLAVDAFLTGKKGFFLGDGAGAGKTRQIIGFVATVQKEKPGTRILVVSTKDVIKGSFQSDAAAFGLPYRVDPSGYGHLGDTKIINDAAFRSTDLREFDVIVFDEVQKARNYNSQVSQNFQNFNGFVFAASATPFDTLPQATILIAKLQGKSVDEFLEEYEGRIGTNRGQEVLEIPDEHAGRLLRDLNKFAKEFVENGQMLVREYPFYGTEETVKISQKEQDSISVGDDGKKITMSLEEASNQVDAYWDWQLERLRLMSSDDIRKRWPGKGMDEIQREIRTNRNNELRKLTETFKATDEVLGMIQKDLRDGKQIVVYADKISDALQFHYLRQSYDKKNEEVIYGASGKFTRPSFFDQITKQLKEKGISFETVTGESKNRAEGIQRFQDGKAKVVIVNQAGTTGINLNDTVGNKPRVLYVVGNIPSAIELEQLKGRVSRLNSKSPSEVRFVTTDSLGDELSAGKVRTKTGVIDSFIRDNTAGIDERQFQTKANVAGTETVGTKTYEFVDLPSGKAFYVPNSFDIKDQLKAMGAKAYKQGGKFKGWMFPIGRKAEVDAAINPQEKQPDMLAIGDDGGRAESVRIETEFGTMEGSYGDTLLVDDEKVKLPRKGFFISDVWLKDEKDKGKGHGKEIYEEALRRYGVLYSAWPVSEEAVNVHNSLIRRGLATAELLPDSEISMLVANHPGYQLVEQQPDMFAIGDDAGWMPSPTQSEIVARFAPLGYGKKRGKNKKDPSQRDITVASYKIIGQIFADQGVPRDGKILDLSAGLGLGAKALREQGYEVETSEPFPEDWTPDYKFASDIEGENKYDAIVNSAVINVIGQDLRDEMIRDIGRLLKIGGNAVVTTRGLSTAEKATISNPQNVKISESEVFVARDGSFQKFFTQDELVAYVRETLGPGFTVQPKTRAWDRKLSPPAVLITKLDPAQPDMFATDAWHGSPHRFDKFELSDKTALTGEGAMAYGYGLYFAGNEEVADYYKKALTQGGTVVDKDGKEVDVAGVTAEAFAFTFFKSNQEIQSLARARAGRISTLG
jgi:hypothetical protein